MKEFVYNGKPQRLSKITAEYYPLFSYNAILKLIKDKEIRVDGAKVGEDVVVNGGSVIRCYAKDMRLKEIYRDENILIVYKPKGLKSEGDISAESILMEYEKGAILCHRLDTNTDGLLIFALNERAAEEIAKGFKNEKIEKVYEARVYGKVPSDAEYRDYLLKNAKEGRESQDFSGKTRGRGARRSKRKSYRIRQKLYPCRGCHSQRENPSDPRATCRARTLYSWRRQVRS